MRRSLLAVTMIGLLSAAAYGTTFYVDQAHPSASDANAGTDPARPWKTIGKSAGSTSVKAGDTVIVKAGTYREQVNITQSGIAGKVITYKANPGDRVIVSGADLVTGWTQLGSTSRNANYAHIYYKDINFVPDRLDEDSHRLVLAAAPNLCYWVDSNPAGSTLTTLVDAAHLTQADSNYWVGASLYYLDPVNPPTVTAYNPATHTITFSPALETLPVAGDWYYINNRLELIDAAGDWAWESIGGGQYRVYVWPSDDGNAGSHTYEIPRVADIIISWGTHSYLVIDGFEICLSHGPYGGNGLGTGSAGSHDITIQNCIVRDQAYCGLNLAVGASYITVKNTLIRDSRAAGILLGSCSNITFQDVQSGPNETDGIDIVGSTNISFTRCFFYQNYKGANHPDGFQMWGGVSNIHMTDCLIMHGGQEMMVSGTDETHLTNCMLVGSEVCLFIAGTGHLDMTHCTLAFSGLSLIVNYNDTEIGRNWTSNIFHVGHNTMIYSFSVGQSYTSDYNVLFQATGTNGNILAWYDGTTHWYQPSTFANYKTATGLETHSVYGDPLFINAPAWYAASCMAMAGIPYGAADKIYLSSTDGFLTGDHLEVDFDGVVRTMTAKGTDGHGSWIQFTPGTSTAVEQRRVDAVVANWKTSTNFAWDLRVQAGSPAIGQGVGGSTCGSTINIQQFLAGDFNGDGLRDVPVWPPNSAPPPGAIDHWAIAVPHGAAGTFTTTVADGYIEPGTAGMAQVRVTFSGALNPGTVNNGSVTIVGAVNGNQASRISGVTLESGNTVLVLSLSSTLPNADRYTLTVSDTVMFANGATLGGTRTRQVGVLAGDVDGSGTVSAADVLAARGRAGQAVDGTTARYDVDCSGTITGADMMAVQSRLGNHLP